MTKLFLILHILAAIVAIGPVAVAASMFPPVARKALAAPGGVEDTATLGVLNRICKVYALVAIAVPMFGFAAAGVMKVTGQTWVVVSIVLTAVAAILLAALVLPRQAELLAGKGPRGREVGVKDTKQLAMYTGIFNLLWAAVTVIMIVRPGSTLGH
ncbi:hypothetical protein [Streptacidiphilus jiangxiensis]|uniref:Uncharacterized protein n=1 Tax=Streptacidiphilus jiangxiensis TaxID=235985 RepID=A0A1H7X9Q4_STRJI|nr:hypothetical protein [Streptacidiphilus jiangxiensis]SEM30451.1 hypothetical protein SAMN05414137_12353 [Streptacidiphilus jiangxiensis]